MFARILWAAACLALVANLGLATPTQAQTLADCGNIYVEAQASCEYNAPSIDCNVACQPLRVQAACAGEAYVDCRGGCDVDVDVGCSASCEASCNASCTATPAEFDCQAYCQADCSGSCEASCASSGDKTRCEASCKGSCSGDCAASCKVKVPTVDCQADCRASCTGSCHARANVDCQIMCQSRFYVQCEADLSGGCRAECMSKEGALFCDGDYVDSGNKVDDCITALQSRLDVQVTGYSEGQCANNTCSGAAGGSASCAALPGGKGMSTPAWGLLAAAGLLASLRRRRARR